jgi:Cu+-exporting ATPase
VTVTGESKAGLYSAQGEEPLAALSSSVDLAVSGMTCSSCSARIEKRLNRLDGVTATVNYATETAAVSYDPAVVAPADLIATIEATGYGARLPQSAAAVVVNQDDQGDATDPDEAAHAVEVFALRQRLTITTVLTLPVLVLAMIRPLQFDNWQWLSLVLASPVVVWGGWPFHRAALANLRHHAATMDTLVSMGTLAAYVWSLYALFFGDAGRPGMRMSFSFGASRGTGSGDIYLEVASAVIVFLLAGRFFEARAKRRSGAALRALLHLGAKDVAVLRSDGREERVPIAQLNVGDLFVIRPGEKIAADGVIVEGASAIDASLLTGESTPIDVTADDPVVGATVNVGGRLLVRATRVGTDTQLAQIARLVTDAQSGKAPVQRLADRISGVFVPVVLVIAVATLAISLAAGLSAVQSFTAAVAVLIVACPCALGLATPTALLVGTGRGAQLGMLIRGPQVLESTRRVDTIVLDKTGTVTTGRMTYQATVAAADEDTQTVLRLAGALEDASEHPVGRAIAEAARAYAVLPPVGEFVNIPGRGVCGIVDGHAVVAGRPSLLAERGMALSDSLARDLDASEADGHTVVAVGWDGLARGIIAVSDQPKPTSEAAIRGLRAIGLRPVLLTGDNWRSAQAVATAVGIPIDDVIANVLPADKVAAVRNLQGEGHVVAMVGDGVNDAAALAQADLGIAMGTGTDAAIEASDITLTRGDLRVAVDAIRLSRRTLTTIKGNLFWAFAYNVVLIPVAALGLLSPLFAGAAMAFSSVFVVSNSLRLRRFRAVETDSAPLPQA